MKKVLGVVVLSITLFMNGCATQKTVKKFSSSDFGNQPNILKYQKQIEEKIKLGLKDPYSAKIGKCLPPIKASLYNTVSGWSTVCPVNAKNSFGGYTGEKNYNAFIGYSKKTKGHFLMSVDPIQVALKDKGLIVFGVND